MCSAVAGRRFKKTSEHYVSVLDWIAKWSMFSVSGEAKTDGFNRPTDNLHPQTERTLGACGSFQLRMPAGQESRMNKDD
jgi:hypothetical protein